jgi:hypothetical protein
MTKHERMMERIEAHGKALQAIFGVTGDPVALCKRLRRLESAFSAKSVDYCNGAIESEPFDAACDLAFEKVCGILGDRARECIHINRDPRGYALKIDDGYMRRHELSLYQDWGGYGILAPDFSQS